MNQRTAPRSAATRHSAGLPLLLAVAAAALVACGGGGDSATESPAPTPVPTPTATALTGKVIDGYLAGATLCLDLNANQSCDSGEPTAVSGGGGAYSLSTTGLDATQVAAAYVLVTVPVTARDEDDAGRTLAEAGKKAFTLLAPVATDAAGAAAPTLVTPLSTLVAQQMISGGLTADQAAQAVRSQYGLPGSGHLNIDYAADSTHAALAVLARVAAVTLGEVQAAVRQGASGQAERHLLLASLAALGQSLAGVQLALGLELAPSALPTPAAIQAAVQPAAATLAADASGVLAAARAAIDGATTPLDALLRLGFGDVSTWTDGCAADAENCNVVTSVHVTDGGDGRWHGASWQAGNGGAFIAQAVDSGWILGADGWQAEAEGGSYSRQADGRYLVTGSDFGAAGALGRLKVEDVSGLPMAVAGEIGVAANALFPAGSQAIWGSFYSGSDRYRLDADDAVHLYVAGQGLQTVASLEALVDGLQSPVAGQPVGQHWGWNGLKFSFDGRLAESGMLSFWSNTGSLLGLGRYQQRSVAGQRVLVVSEAPRAALDAAAAGNSRLLGDWANRRRPVFGLVNGVVYLGSTTPAGTTTDQRPSLNLPALSALLAARGLCQLPNASGQSVCPGRP